MANLDVFLFGVFVGGVWGLFIGCGLLLWVIMNFGRDCEIHDSGRRIDPDNPYSC
jgi:hypothetical protein